MLVREEVKILSFLQNQPTCTLRQILQSCLEGTPEQLALRILDNLEWLGYVTVFPGAGDGTGVQITTKGRAVSLRPI